MSEITPIYGDDPELVAAVFEARRLFPQFRAELEADWKRKIPVITMAMVKARFISKTTCAEEHMWVDVSNFDGDGIVGTLANSPNEIPELHEGDEVRVKLVDLSDWVYSNGDSVVGGFTVAVLERRENESQP